MNCNHCQDKGTVNKYHAPSKTYRDYPCGFCARTPARSSSALDFLSTDPGFMEHIHEAAEEMGIDIEEWYGPWN